MVYFSGAEYTEWEKRKRERAAQRLISHVGGISMCPNELTEATSISSDVMLKWKLIVQYGSTQMPRVSHNPYHVAWPNECILIDVGRREKLISSVIRVLKITIKWNSGMNGKERGRRKKKNPETWNEHLYPIMCSCLSHRLWASHRRVDLPHTPVKLGLESLEALFIFIV